MTVRVFDCPTLGRGAYKDKTPIAKIAGVLCECFQTHLAGEVNLRDEEGEP